MSSPASLVSAKLVTAGVGTAGTNLFVGKMPEGATLPAVALFDSGGSDPMANLAVDFPSVQAVIRSAPDAYIAGYAKAQAVKNALLGIAPDSVIRGITMKSDIFHVGPDEMKRHEFTINFRLVIEPTSVGNRTDITP